ncbi:hypothetical protein L1889_11110 [Paenalcaligenes niemegkensis]|uniref:hypothetical protein n=1 Tax=Paenalcaligenes niemegkensis TaxID=2895469 RepID=UPI001EE7E2E8|nr:hypothetical protein [Paenalcaligenes niemegkensis]MCQ9617175.1 hypothetical protein [Paenalcaligenes niemegkensis]
MWIDLLSMAAVGILVACMVFIIRRSLTKRDRTAPRWILPVTIGASMISYSVWNEYTWFDRITSSLPSAVAVVAQGERSSPWAPWTYLRPVTIRFIALDTRTRVQSELQAGLVLTELLLVERWQRTRRVPVAFDCHQARRADLLGDTHLTSTGKLENGHWQTMKADDPMLHAACQSPLPG